MSKLTLEMYENTKGVIRSRHSKVGTDNTMVKRRKNKRINNDIQNITRKPKD